MKAGTIGRHKEASGNAKIRGEENSKDLERARDYKEKLSETQKEGNLLSRIPCEDCMLRARSVSQSMFPAKFIHIEAACGSARDPRGPSIPAFYFTVSETSKSPL